MEEKYITKFAKIPEWSQNAIREKNKSNLAILSKFDNAYNSKINELISENRFDEVDGYIEKII